MSVVLVVLAIKVLIAPRGFPCHFIWPLKVWFVLDFLHTRCTGSRNTALIVCTLVAPDCPTKSLLGWLLLYWSDLKSLLSEGMTFSFPFPYSWSSSTRLYLSIRSISWRTLVAGLPVRDFLKPCSTGRLFLKVLMVTSSKLPSISLYISQYLLE